MICEFCNKEFKSFAFFEKHNCDQKLRYSQKNEKYFKYGYIAYKTFYNKFYPTMKINEYTFIQNKMYKEFITFGKHLEVYDVIDFKSYINYLIENKYHLNKWYNEECLKTFNKKFLENETMVQGTERTFMNIEKMNSTIENYFINTTNAKFTSDILSYKLSPWILLSSEKSIKKLKSLSKEQLTLIGNIIDHNFWKRKFDIFDKDFILLKSTLKEYNI